MHSGNFPSQQKLQEKTLQSHMHYDVGRKTDKGQERKTWRVSKARGRKCREIPHRLGGWGRPRHLWLSVPQSRRAGDGGEQEEERKRQQLCDLWGPEAEIPPGIQDINHRRLPGGKDIFRLLPSHRNDGWGLAKGHAENLFLWLPLCFKVTIPFCSVPAE